MALDDRDDQDSGSGLRPMTPERAAERDAVLKGMLAGDHENEDEGRPVRRAKGSGKGPSRAPSSRDEGAREAVRKPKVEKIVVDAEPDDDDPAHDLIDDEDLEEGLLDADPPKPKKTPAKPKPKAKPAADLDDEDDEDDDTDDDQDDDDDELDLADADDDDDPDADDDDDDEPDDKASARIKAMERKSMARIAARDKKAREQDRERRVAMERDQRAWEAEWRPKMEQTKAVLSIVEAAKRNPVGAILQFAEEVAGVQGDDWEVLGKTSYLRSPKAQADPKNRDAASRAAREAEHRAELEQVKRKNEELEQKMTAREEAEANRAAVADYLDRVVDAVTPETRLVRRLLRKNPEGARAELHALASEYARATGHPPTPAKLVRLKEKRERGRLLQLGIDPDSLFRQKKKDSDQGGADPAPRKKAAAKQKAAGTANGKSRLSGKALRQDVLDGLPG